jgi:galactitol-specific phosphotransferase system IIB component
LKLYLNLEKSYKDEKGEGIERAKKYLTKYSKIIISQDTSMFLADFNKIRNALTHANGKINEIKDNSKKLDLIKTINKGNGLFLSDNEREFIITNNYIKYIDSKIKTTIHEIIFNIIKTKEI